MRRLSYVTHFVHKTFKTNVISEVLLVEGSPKALKTEAFQHVPVGRDRSVMSGAWTTILIRNTAAVLFTAGAR
jgi:hypothetical protein